MRRKEGRSGLRREENKNPTLDVGEKKRSSKSIWLQVSPEKALSRMSRMRASSCRMSPPQTKKQERGGGAEGATEAPKSESTTAQYKKHRCVPKIALPDARTQPLILPDEGLILQDEPPPKKRSSKRFWLQVSPEKALSRTSSISSSISSISTPPKKKVIKTLPAAGFS